MQQEALLQQIIQRIKDVRGLKALVLGGSYASGTQRADSDLDIGLYYYEKEPLDTSALRVIATGLNDTSDPVVTDLGGWGAWVNGGAWLSIQGQRVDFLYRNIDLVNTTIDECNAGIIRADYWQQPAYGFHSFMYCTETFINRPLYDPEHILEQLKAKVAAYSPELRSTIIKNFLWSARFTLENTHKAAKRGEVYGVTGCLARAIHGLVQVLYALNETYYISEKQLEKDVRSFNIQPEHFLERVYAILGEVGMSSTQLQASLTNTEALYTEISHLVAQQAI